LVEWTFHHLDQGLLVVCFANTFGIEWLRSPNLPLPLLLPLNNLENTFLIVGVGIECFSVKSLEFLGEHDLPGLLVICFDGQEVLISLVFIAGFDGEFVRVLNSLDVTSISGSIISDIVHVVDVHILWLVAK